jgi:hypothetical protein
MRSYGKMSTLRQFNQHLNAFRGILCCRARNAQRKCLFVFGEPVLGAPHIGFTCGGFVAVRAISYFVTVTSDLSVNTTVNRIATVRQLAKKLYPAAFFVFLPVRAFSSITACAAANLAIGTRNGDALT